MLWTARKDSALWAFFLCVYVCAVLVFFFDLGSKPLLKSPGWSNTSIHIIPLNIIELGKTERLSAWYCTNEARIYSRKDWKRSSTTKSDAFFSCWIKNPTKNPIIVEDRFPQILFYHTRFFHVAMWYSIRTNIVALIFQYINMQLLL